MYQVSGLQNNIIYKIIRIVCVLSLVNRCVYRRVCWHFIGYVLSDARFDWLVGNMSAYQENLFPSRSKQHFPPLSNYSREIFYKTNGTRRVGRIADSYANPRLSLGFAQGGGRRLGWFLCQNHPTKSDVTSGWKLSWTLVSLETKDGGSTRNIFFYILNWQLPKLYTMTV